jgi:phosphoserine phosphatase
MKYELILFDVDSTLIKEEVIDLLAEKSGHGPEVSQITAQAMRGEIDFLQALEMRLALLEGLPESVFDEVLSQISFSDGFSELFEYLRQNHFLIGAVSGGFHNVLDELFADLNLDFLRANTLEVKDSKISGKLLSQPIDRAAKGQALKEFAAFHEIKLEQTVAVGDGANDIEMIELAGLGVSYMGKEILKSRADLHLDRPGLDALIQYLK